MCGINGVFAYNPVAGSPKESELLTVREAMRRRGPDGAGSWWSADKRCGLAHRRLSIVDLSERAAQPMKSRCGRYVISFNGEIYNYAELMRDLGANGFRFRTTSDTEVLLALFARDGAKMVQHLRGMFAFAIWDNTERRLFLARDPYGIKPLYTADDGWTFRFASQVKAILATAEVSRDPDPAGVVGFCLFGHVPEPFTLYRHVRALPAGHVQWIDEVGPREPKPYVSLAATLAEGARHPMSRNALASQVRESVRDSVKAHLTADVEVGVFLSAGIDSGSLLGVMRDARQANIRAITLGFDEFAGTVNDEVPLAAEATELYGAEHVVRRVSESEFRNDLPYIFEAMDQPSIDGVNTWFVAKAAREAGLKVAISGLGGDELFAGYQSFRDLPRWRHGAGVIAAIPGLGAISRSVIKNLAPRLARKHPKALGMLSYANSWAGAYFLRRALYLPPELSTLLDGEVVREGLRRLKPLARIADTLRPDPGSDCGRVCVLESSWYMQNQLLRDADWAGMAHGLEIRVPLVDYRLLQRLSPALAYFGGGAGKALLAAAPSRPLPTSITERAKTGFAVPTSRWAIKTESGVPGDIEPGLVSRRWSHTVLDALAVQQLAA